MTSRIANLIGFQLGWFACVLGAASGRPLLGVYVVFAWIAIDRLLFSRGARSWMILPVAALMGYAFDSILVLLGVIRFPSHAIFGSPAPIWMVALWINLAGTLDGILAWLKKRYFPAALLGAVLSPIAYYFGERLGALHLSESTLFSLTVIASGWFVAMPLLLLLHERLQCHSSHCPFDWLTAALSRRRS